MPIIYLDNCALQRPLDNRDQLRIRIEAEAITAVLEAVESDKVELATSAALRAESSRSSQQNRRDFVQKILSLARHEAPKAETFMARIKVYGELGMAPFDAMHLASAVSMRADFFCSTDDRLLRKARMANTETTRVVTPLELAQALNL
ncbi:MAG: PIN domain-containing protein [Rhodothermales bacterium]